MITIGERVQRAAHYAEAGQFEYALEQAAIAIDVTAKRHYASPRSSRSNYKKLINEYAWLIELQALGGLNIEESKFANYPIEGNAEPTFADLIYHVVRCGLVHDEGVPNDFTFVDGNVLTMSQGHLSLPKSIIWALLSVVVFCPANKNESAPGNCWLAMFENRFVVNDFWGQEHVARLVQAKRPRPRVALNWPATDGHGPTNNAADPTQGGRTNEQ